MYKKQEKAFSVLTRKLLLNSIKEVSLFAKGDLLDVGCGESPYINLFKPKVSRYIRTDWTKSFHGLDGIQVYSSALNLPFKAETFDTVLCTEVLEHTFNPERVIEEIIFVLRKGGVAILTTPFLFWIHEEPYDYFRPTKFFFQQVAWKYDAQIVYVKERGGFICVLIQTFSNGMWLLLRAFLRNEKLVLLSTYFLVSLPQKLACLIVRFLERYQKRDPLSHVFNLGYTVVLRKKGVTQL
jgi:SAM-dependent methyltransferase